MLDQVDVEVDGAVEGHEKVGDVGHHLDPVRPLNGFRVVNLSMKKKYLDDRIFLERYFSKISFD